MGACSTSTGLGSPDGPEPHSGLRPSGAIPSAAEIQDIYDLIIQRCGYEYEWHAKGAQALRTINRLVEFATEQRQPRPQQALAADHTLWPAGEYRKKPVVIDAYRFDNRIWNHPPHWLTQAMSDGTVVHHANHLLIKTLEGDMRANFDDWIIKGVKGEIYPCKPDIFAATYEPALPMRPEPVGEELIDALARL